MVMKSNDIERNDPVQPRHTSTTSTATTTTTTTTTNINNLSGNMAANFLHLISYSNAPATWPRRLLCDNCPSLCCWSSLRDTKTCRWVFFLVLLTYFISMDTVLYRHFLTADLVKGSKPADPSELYSPFTHLSVKALISDQPSQFLKTPSAEYFNRITGFSSVFYFITPNVISTTHLLCAFISGKFIASSVLNDRRIGVALFCFRSWLDALDGVVFRAQNGRHLQFRSNPSTLGYYIDAIFDIVGGVFLCFGVLFHLLKRFKSTKKFPGNNLNLPLLSVAASPSRKSLLALNGSAGKHSKMALGSSVSSSIKPDQSPDGGDEHYSFTVSCLFWKTLTLGICMAVSGFCWNSSMQKFTSVFQTEIKDQKLSSLQFEYSHSLPTILVFAIWRLIGSMAILNYVLAAIFFDKIWAMLQGPQLVLLFLNVVMYGFSYLYIQDIQASLQL